MANVKPAIPHAQPACVSASEFRASLRIRHGLSGMEMCQSKYK